jgi:hypothetical protein
MFGCHPNRALNSRSLSERVRQKRVATGLVQESRDGIADYGAS